VALQALTNLVSTIAAENITFEEQGADEDVWD
jgi:hypothetical protein